MTQKEKVILEEEYENSAVPLKARKSITSIALVWVGFPMIFTGTVTGGTIVSGLGFWKGLLAVLLGNLILFGYVGILGMLSANKGYNFGLQASVTFGRKGSMVMSGLLSTLVIGWFAVQTGLTGTNMNQAFGSNLLLLTLIAGILYIAITLIGVKALTYIGAVSAPVFVILGLWAVNDAVTKSGWSSISHYGGNGTLSFGVAVTMVVALFADSGTMASDFNRWSKNKKEALISSSMAFPIANMIAMLFGGLIVAAASKNSDFFQYIASKGGAVSVISIVLLFLNLGSVCSHCLYNASVGWSNLLGKKMRSTALVLGVIGTIIAILGIYNHFIQWLNVLGIIVPPIGAVIIMDQLLLRRNADITTSFRFTPFIGWGVGALIGLITDFYAPFLSTAFISLLSGGLAYGIASLFTSKLSNLAVQQNLDN